MDGHDFLAEQYLTNGRSVVVMQHGQFQCPKGQKRAILTNGTGGAWVGCWSDDGSEFLIRWEDGDELRVPKQQIRNAGPRA